MKNKTCTKCGKVKLMSEFHKKLDKRASSCKDCISIDKKSYQVTNKEAISKRRKLSRLSNLEERRKQDKETYLKNRSVILKRNTKRCIIRYNTDPVYKLRKNISKQIRMVLTGYRVYTTKARMYEITELTGEELKDHLWSTFEARYSKTKDQVLLEDIHVDHIIPLITAKTEGDIIRLNHYTNLQLLLKEDNIEKGIKLPDELAKEIK